MALFYKALGLMSGTALDGVDVSYVVTDGITVKELGPCFTLTYSEALISRCKQLQTRASDLSFIAETEYEVTMAHSHAVEQFCAYYALDKAMFDIIGFHGQTIYHDPKKNISWQLGNGSLLAQETGIDVICDFRRQDVAMKGQGAPLVPIFHQALFKEQKHPLAIVNIGGVANVTYLDQSAIHAFDTGIGNGLMNDYMRENTVFSHDENGEYARKGMIHEDRLKQLLSDPYFAQLPPKSLDRHYFSLDAVRDLSREDAMATLCAFTAYSIANATSFFKELPLAWIITGGGRHNTELMARLAELCAAPVYPIEHFGYDGDGLEAQAFAFLAIRALKNMPYSFPTTTGVKLPASGGAYYRAFKALH